MPGKGSSSCRRPEHSALKEVYMAWLWLRDPGQWWAEARSQSLEGLVKFGLNLEGTGEPWKACR